MEIIELYEEYQSEEDKLLKKSPDEIKALTADAPYLLGGFFALKTRYDKKMYLWDVISYDDWWWMFYLYNLFGKWQTRRQKNIDLERDPLDLKRDLFYFHHPYEIIIDDKYSRRMALMLIRRHIAIKLRDYIGEHSHDGDTIAGKVARVMYGKYWAEKQIRILAEKLKKVYNLQEQCERLSDLREYVDFSNRFAVSENIDTHIKALGVLSEHVDTLRYVYIYGSREDFSVLKGIVEAVFWGVEKDIHNVVTSNADADITARVKATLFYFYRLRDFLQTYFPGIWKDMEGMLVLYSARLPQNLEIIANSLLKEEMGFIDITNCDGMCLEVYLDNIRFTENTLFEHIVEKSDTVDQLMYYISLVLNSVEEGNVASVLSFFASTYYNKKNSLMMRADIPYHALWIRRLLSMQTKIPENITLLKPLVKDILRIYIQFTTPKKEISDYILRLLHWTDGYLFDYEVYKLLGITEIIEGTLKDKVLFDTKIDSDNIHILTYFLRGIVDIWFVMGEQTRSVLSEYIKRHVKEIISENWDWWEIYEIVLLLNTMSIFDSDVKEHIFSIVSKKLEGESSGSVSVQDIVYAMGIYEFLVEKRKELLGHLDNVDITGELSDMLPVVSVGHLIDSIKTRDRILHHIGGFSTNVRIQDRILRIITMSTLQKESFSQMADDSSQYVHVVCKEIQDLNDLVAFIDGENIPIHQKRECIKGDGRVKRMLKKHRRKGEKLEYLLIAADWLGEEGEIKKIVDKMFTILRDGDFTKFLALIKHISKRWHLLSDITKKHILGKLEDLDKNEYDAWILGKLTTLGNLSEFLHCIGVMIDKGVRFSTDNLMGSLNGFVEEYVSNQKKESLEDVVKILYYMVYLAQYSGRKDIKAKTNKTVNKVWRHIKFAIKDLSKTVPGYLYSLSVYVKDREPWEDPQEVIANIKDATKDGYYPIHLLVALLSHIEIEEYYFIPLIKEVILNKELVSIHIKGISRKYTFDMLKLFRKIGKSISLTALEREVLYYLVRGAGIQCKYLVSYADVLGRYLMYLCLPEVKSAELFKEHVGDLYLMMTDNFPAYVRAMFDVVSTLWRGTLKPILISDSKENIYLSVKKNGDVYHKVFLYINMFKGGMEYVG